MRAGRRRVMLAAPTGFGKTLLAAMVVESALQRGKRVIVTVPAISLVNQTVAALEAEGIDAVGVMQGFHERSDIRQPVQVCSIQTLQRRKIPPADVVLIDEAHLWFQFYARWFGDPDWLTVPFIGLSATPWSRGLGKHYEELIQVSTTAQLIAGGFLTPFRVFAPDHPDLKGVRTSGGDFNEADLAGAMNKPSLVADVVSTWLARGENRPTLCFGVDRAHAKAIQQQFEACGVPAGYIDAYTKLEEREEIGRRFHAGDLKIVCNVATLTTGVDWDVRCIILARPTRSRILYVQIVGRGLRNASSKADLLLLDHSDSTLRLGFVTDIAQDYLDDGKSRGPAEARDRDQPKPKECPACKFVKPAKVAACPSCGFKPARQSKIECEDGELIELTDIRRTGTGRPRMLTVDTRRDVYGQLKGYGHAHGYKPGWAKRKFVDLTGIWPDGVENARPVEPDPALARWIRSQNIRYAKGRAAHGR